ncbi:MAG: CvpA family protein, partial [Oscillibacter sp.]|nr:CvpA family protein [Oscillibacter sp.]
MAFVFNFGGFNPGGFGGFGGFQNTESTNSGESPFQQTPPTPKKPKKPRKAIGNAFTRTLINLGVTLLFALVYFYVELPALNFHAEEF